MFSLFNKISYKCVFPRYLRLHSLSKPNQIWLNGESSLKWALCKKFRVRSFLWSVFSRIRSECGDLQNKSPNSVRIRENKDQRKLRIPNFHKQWKLLQNDIKKQEANVPPYGQLFSKLRKVIQFYILSNLVNASISFSVWVEIFYCICFVRSLHHYSFLILPMRSKYETEWVMMRTTQATSVIHVLTKSTLLALRLLYLMTQER